MMYGFLRMFLNRSIGIFLSVVCASSVGFSVAEAQNGATSAAAEAAPDAQLSEITVTAQKREESSRDVPITLTVFNEAAIQDHGFSDLTDYAKFVPGLVYNGTGLGERSGPDITIRGVANSRLYDFETNIGTATTGFVYGEVPAYSFNPDLVDVQRIEILKGPQGTLYGAAAMGGLVKVVPNAPDFTAFSGTALVGGAATGSGWGAAAAGGTVSAVLNAPLSDVLAVRTSFYLRSDPGYINVHFLNGNPNQQFGPDPLVGFNSLQTNVYGTDGFAKNANGSGGDGGRVALRYKPNDKFDATLSFMYDATHTNSLPNYEPVLSTKQSPLTADQYILQPSSTNYALTSLEASQDFGFAVLHSITGLIERTHSSAVDFTGVLYNALGGNGTVPAPTPGVVGFSSSEHIFSQELRLQGNATPLPWFNSSLDWTVGAFYQREERNALGNALVGPNWLTEAEPPLVSPPGNTTSVWQGNYVATYTNKAVFADATLHITPRLAASAGVRYSKQNLEAVRTDFSDLFAGCPPAQDCSSAEPASGSKTTPRADLEFKATDQINLYAAYSTGYRIGGANAVGTLTTAGCAVALQKFGVTDPAGVAQFKSDDLRNIEAGIKSAFDNNRVSVNVTVFQEDWTNLQSSVLLLQYSPACGGSFVTNAGAARMDGVDAEIRALLTEHLEAYATGQYNNARIVDVGKGAPGTKGAPLEASPKTQGTAGIEYRMRPRSEWTATARIDYAYVGPRNMSNTNTPVDPRFELPGYGETNVRFAVNHDGWEYTTYVNNLTDTIPQLGVQIYSGGPGNYSGAYSPGAQRQITTSPPRTFGITIRKSF